MRRHPDLARRPLPLQFQPRPCQRCGVSVDQETGTLALVDHTPCGGATPRNLALTPSGRHLLSANQNADRINIFARDAATGRLADTGRSIDIGTPMCVKIVR
nr:beta-propeller fold lactonase family protein [Mesorhizobium sp.]